VGPDRFAPAEMNWAVPSRCGPLRACPRIGGSAQRKVAGPESDHSRERHRPRRRIQEPVEGRTRRYRIRCSATSGTRELPRRMHERAFDPGAHSDRLDRSHTEQAGCTSCPPRDWRTHRKWRKANGSRPGDARAVGLNAPYAPSARAYAGGTSPLRAPASATDQTRRAARFQRRSPSSKRPIHDARARGATYSQLLRAFRGLVNCSGFRSRTRSRSRGPDDLPVG